MAAIGAQERQIIQQAAQTHGIEPRILAGVYGTETSFGKDASTSSAGAEGPFQLEPGTAASLGVRNTQDFAEAANGAAKYLAQFKGRGLAGMLSAYNAGPAAGLQQEYVDKVLANSKAWGGEMAPALARIGAAGGAPGSVSVSQPVESATQQQGLASLLAALGERQQHAAASPAGEPVGLVTPGELTPIRELARSSGPSETSLLALVSKIGQGEPTTVTTQDGTAAQAAAAGAKAGDPGAGAVTFGVKSLGKYAESEGQNLGPELDKLEKSFGMTGEPWCAIFATTAAAQGGAATTTRTASVAAINQWAQEGSHGYAKGLLPSSQAEPGDLLTFGDQHVALVKERHGNTIVTIEGNADGSGGVVQLTHQVGEGQIARPKYG